MDAKINIEHTIYNLGKTQHIRPLKVMLHSHENAEKIILKTKKFWFNKIPTKCRFYSISPSISDSV